MAALMLNTLILIVIFSVFRLIEALSADLGWLDRIAHGGFIS